MILLSVIVAWVALGMLSFGWANYCYYREMEEDFPGSMANEDLSMFAKGEYMVCKFFLVYATLGPVGFLVAPLVFKKTPIGLRFK